MYLAFSPDGKYVVTGGGDNIAKISYVDTGKEAVRIEHDDTIYSVAFSPDGKYVVTGGGDNIAKISYADTGKEAVRIEHDTWIWSVTFSPDGKYVVTGGGNNTAHFFRVDTGKEVAQIQHDNWISSVSFSLNSRYIVTGSSDNMALISPVESIFFVIEICERTQQNLSAKLWQRYINPDLSTYRLTCPENPVHPTVIRSALALISDNKTRQARAILNRVHKLDPTADLYPPTPEIETSPKVAMQKQQEALQKEGGTR